jgi:hypothetical protein
VLLLVSKIGLNKIDNFDVAIVGLTSSPLSYPANGNPEATYLMSNWLGPAVLNMLGITGERNLYLVHSAFSLLFVFAIITFLFRALPEIQARVAAVLFLVLPIAAVPFHWVGYDSLTLLLIALLLLLQKTPLVLLLAVLAGLQHAEMIVTSSLLALLFSHFSPDHRSIFLSQKKLCTTALGGLIGRGILEAIFRLNGISVSSRLAEAIDNVERTIGMWAKTAPVILISMLGMGWIVIAAGWRRNVIPRAGTAGVLGCALLLNVVVLDQTRIAATSTLLVITLAVLLNGRLLSSIPPSTAFLLLLAWWLLPGLWVWEGQVEWYGTFSGVRALLTGG